jgi:hypothetical protein
MGKENNNISTNLLNSQALFDKSPTLVFRNKISDYFYISPATMPSALGKNDTRRLAKRRTSDSIVLKNVAPVIMHTGERNGSISSALEVEDFSQSIVRKLRKNAQLPFLKSEQSLSTTKANNNELSERLHHSWASIYHDNAGSDFKYIDSKQSSANTSPRRSSEFISSNTNRHRLQVPGHDSSTRLQSRKNQPKSHYLSTTDLVKTRSYVLNKVELPGVRIKLTVEKRYEKDDASWRFVEKYRNTENVRLNPAHINQLRSNDKLHKMNANDAQEFYFHPKSLSFTPFMTYNGDTQVKTHIGKK